MDPLPEFGPHRERWERLIEYQAGFPFAVPDFEKRTRAALVCLCLYNDKKPALTEQEAESVIARLYYHLRIGNTTTAKIAGLGNGLGRPIIDEAQRRYDVLGESGRAQLIEWVLNT
jgi:hypothetical protein